MTISNKTTLKTYFITGATPSQSNFVDLIDTFLGLNEVSQTVSGAVIFNNAVNITANGALTVSGATNLDGSVTINGTILGTAATLNVGVSANNIPQINSSNQLPAVSGALLTNIPSKFSTAQVTDSTDIVLSVAPTQANIGSTKSVTIPTKGLIRISFSGQLIAATGGNSVTIGIRIGSTNYWPISTLGGNVSYAQIDAFGGSGAATDTIGSLASFMAFVTGAAGGDGGNNPQNITLMIEALSIPTGTQTIQVIASKMGSNGVTIKGTVQTSIVNLEFIDCS